MTGNEMVSKDHVNAIAAAVTASLQGERIGGPDFDRAMARVLNEVPHGVQFGISSFLIWLLLRQLARAEGRDVEQVWQDIALILAKEVPEDG